MRRLLVLMVGLFGGMACGSSGSPSPLTADEACADVAHARCARLQGCSAAVLQIRFGDEATCEAREKNNCVGALAAPGTGNNPTHTEACSQAVGSWTCAAFIDDTAVPTACQQQTGSVATGQPCAFPGQCQSGFCAIVPGGICGTCALSPAAGASCAQLTTCGPGLICAADTSTCTPYATSGGACGKGAPCGAGLSCVGANARTGVMGTCMVAASPVGAACDPNQQTGPGCDRAAGLACNSLTKQCAPLVIAAGGQPCGAVNNQTGLCSAGGTCSASSPASGTCTAAAADGTACDTAAGPDCGLLARCIVASGGTSGTCQVASATTCH